ncbi:MAG: hypothetical protein GX561_03320 [Lentisphaerae bacterium]|jgi:cell shape-determining protein MreC|nr:hypothetical protein [Lentisphaerota bacterium]
MKQRAIVAAIAAFILALVLIFIPSKFTDKIAAATRFFTQPAQAWADFTGRVAKAVLGDETAALKPNDKLDLQNELAMSQTALNAAWAQYATAIHENKFLKNRLRLVYDDNRFTLTLCKIIKRDPIASFYDRCIINRGYKDGLRTGQLVLAIPPEPENGEERSQPSLLGIIRDVAPDNATVTLTTASDFTMTCNIPERNVTGLLIGRANKSDQKPQIIIPPGSLVLSDPAGAEYDAVQVGDKVFTSSLGNNPEGIDNILVGYVQQITTADTGAPILLIQQPAQNAQVTYVLVALKAITQ